MTDERKSDCIKCFNNQILWVHLMPTNITVAEFIENFAKDMSDKYGDFTDDDLDYALELLKDWKKESAARSN